MRPFSLESIKTDTADGQALKEVCLILASIEHAPKLVREGALGYLKSRYRQPVHILTADDLDPPDAFDDINEKSKQV
jgi:hypothetical protein